MKKRMNRVLLVLATSILLFASACGKVENSVKPSTTPDISAVDDSTEATNFSVVDMVGKSIEFDKTPERIIALLASDVEILYEIGAKDSIVAVGEYCNYPSEVIEKEKIATGDKLNTEQIIAMDPDVVIMGVMGQTKEQTEQLENAGIKVVATNSENIEDTYKAISLLGQISGKAKEAESLIERMKTDFQEIKAKVDDNKKDATIYYEVSPLVYGLWTAGQNTFMQELADIVGIKNIFEDVTGWAEISEEQVLERNPDYIMTVSMYFEGEMTPSDEILSRKNWANVNAVKNKKVISDETDMFTRPGPRLVDAAKQLYELVYGE